MTSWLRARPAFRRLWAAATVSQVGDWLSFVAVSALALEAGGGALGLALVLAAHALPAAVLSPVAGALVDRADRRRVMIGADLLAAVVTAAMAAAAMAGAVVAVQLLLLARSAITAATPPAETAAVRRLVHPDELVRANAILAVTWSAAFVAGMALGGVAALLGPALALALDAGTFLVAAALRVSLPAMPPATSPVDGASPGRGVVATATGPARGPALATLLRETPRDTVAALRVAARRPALLAAVLGKAPLGLAGGASWIALNLVGAERAPLGAAALSFGVLQAVRGAGTGLGPALASRLERRGVSEAALGWAARAAMLGAILALAVARSPWALVAVALVWGMGGGTNWLLSHVALQRHAPDEVIGRLAALDELLVTAAMVLGAFAGAAAVAHGGTELAALGGAALGAAAIAAAALVVAAARRAEGGAARAMGSAPGPASGERELAEEVALAEVDAAVAQDRVRGREVEVEVGEHEVIEVVTAAHRLALHPGVGAGAVLGADELPAIERAHVGDAGVQAGAQVGESLLGVGVGRRLGAGELGAGVLGGVARGLELAAQRPLIGRQPPLHVELGIERAGLGVGDRLVEPAVDVAEELGEDGDRRVEEVHRAHATSGAA